MQNQSFQDYHTLLKWQYYPELVLSTVPYPLKIKTDKISPFETITPSQYNIIIKNSHFIFTLLPKWKSSTIIPLKRSHPLKVKITQTLIFWRPSHPPKVDIIQNESLQNHHKFPKCKLSITGHFKPTASSQSPNCQKSVLARLPYPPKVEIIQN